MMMMAMIMMGAPNEMAIAVCPNKSTTYNGLRKKETNIPPDLLLTALLTSSKSSSASFVAGACWPASRLALVSGGPTSHDPVQSLALLLRTVPAKDCPAQPAQVLYYRPPPPSPQNPTSAASLWGSPTSFFLLPSPSSPPSSGRSNTPSLPNQPIRDCSVQTTSRCHC